MRFRPLLPVVLAVLLTVASAQIARPLAATLDQKQELDCGAGFCFPSFDQKLGQEFKPSLPVLEAVDVKLVNGRWGSGGYTFTLTIREGTIDGTILATATQLVNYDFGGWLRFTLSLRVVPGLTYVIRLQATSAPFCWLYAEGNPYPNGRLIQVNPQAGNDFAFRTYGSTSGSVGGVVLPTNIFLALTPYLVAIGLVVTAVTVKKRRN